jgi:structural maintenance of chromosome 2
MHAAYHSTAALSAAWVLLAGAEAGDGRDESNRSLQERLADAQNAASAAESEAKQADVRSKHLAKQASEQRKALASKDKEAKQWQGQLQAAKKTVADCQTKLQVRRRAACWLHSPAAGSRVCVPVP